MSNVGSLTLFLIFVAIIVAIRLTGRRGAVAALFAYIVAVLAALAIMRRDAWPFATHGVFLEKADAQRPLSTMRFVAVDKSGQEHPIDPDSWSPIHVRTLAVWWLACVLFELLGPVNLLCEPLALVALELAF